MSENLDSRSWDAAGWHGDDDRVRALLAKGANPDTRSGSGALVFAVAADRRSTVELLLAAGARVDSIDYPTNTPRVDGRGAWRCAGLRHRARRRRRARAAVAR